MGIFEYAEHDLWIIPLSIERQADLQRIFLHCHVLIIGEKSIPSLITLYQIDRHLRDIYSKPDTDFGGLGISSIIRWPH